MLKHKKHGIEGAVAQTLLYLSLAVIIALVLMPIVITFLYSLKLPYEHMMSIWRWPSDPQWGYYGEAFHGIWGNMFNSLIVCVVTTIGVVFFSSATAYVFSRHHFFGKEVLFSLVLALMMVPSVLTMTPSYLTVLKLGLFNTRWALILPGIAGGQVGAIFLFRTFFSQQPASLFESATLDGANDLVLYAKITLPLAVPVLIIQGHVQPDVQRLSLAHARRAQRRNPDAHAAPQISRGIGQHDQTGRGVRHVSLGGRAACDHFADRAQILYQRRFRIGHEVVIYSEEMYEKTDLCDLDARIRVGAVCRL